MTHVTVITLDNGEGHEASSMGYWCVWQSFMRIERFGMVGESLEWARHTLSSFHPRLGDSNATKKRSWMPNSAFVRHLAQRQLGRRPVNFIGGRHSVKLC